MKTTNLFLLSGLLLLNTVTMHAQQKHKVIENEFSLYHQSVDQLYWTCNDTLHSRYIFMKTPLMLTDKWKEIIAPYRNGETFSAFPFQHDKDFGCTYHLVENRLLLTNVCAFFENICKEKLLHHLDSLLPEKFTHEYDNILQAHNIDTASYGAMPITWVDSLDIRNFKSFKRRHESEKTTDEFFNRLDVHPYLRLYFKEGILTNIKFITPKVKEE